MPPSSVYFLVFHGSHDPRSQQAARQLTEAFRQRMSYSSQVGQAVGQEAVGAGDRRIKLGDSQSDPNSSHPSPAPETSLWVQDVYLECVPLPLHQQLGQWIDQCPALFDPPAAIASRLIPVFLLPGTHVMQDIPAEIASLQANLPRPLPLTVTPHLGSQVGLRRVLNEKMSLHPMEAWILIAHGSRRAGANQVIERLAEQVGAITAYWTTEPDLAQRVMELSELGIRRIGILPYFLFSGGITDAIAQKVTVLGQQLPHLKLLLTDPLEVNQAELADLLVNLAISEAIAPVETVPVETVSVLPGQTEA